MLTIKDFKPGDAVCTVQLNMGRKEKPSIAEKTVKTVGRKYVTLDDCWNSKYENCEKEYLHEHVTCGESRLLFLTRKDAEDYLEKLDLISWLRNFIKHDSKIIGCTINQLRQVKEILTKE